MTNEMKLLMALCDALGFEVETTLDYQERKENQHEAMRHNQGNGFPETDRHLLHTNGRLDIDEDGWYRSRLDNPEMDYKLTKKEGNVFNPNFRDNMRIGPSKD